MAVDGPAGFPSSNSSDQCQTQCRDLGPTCQFFSFTGGYCYLKKDKGSLTFDPKFTSGPATCPTP